MKSRDKRRRVKQRKEACKAFNPGKPVSTVVVGSREIKILNLTSNEPCGHPGCLSHVSHPCEGCGRIAGRSKEA